MSDVIIYDSLYDNISNQRFIVPNSLPINFKVKLFNSSDILYIYPTNSHQYGWVTGDPGTTLVLDNTNHPYLLVYSYDLTDTNEFKFISYSSPGIYSLTIYYYYNLSDYFQFYITDKNAVTLGEMKKSGLIFPSNVRYMSWLAKYSDFNSVDEFLSKPYIFNPKFHSVLLSNNVEFRIK